MTSNLDESVRIINLLNDFYSTINKKVVWILPNNDPGSRQIMEELTKIKPTYDLELVSNLSPKSYYKLMSSALMAIGNSSSYVRDSSMLAIPVILLGSRQNNREISNNVQLLEDPSINSISKLIRNLISYTIQKSYFYGNQVPAN